MLGAIIGDIAGSRFEWNNIKTKDFELLSFKCFVTDDSIMSLAVAKAILDCKGDYTDLSQKTIRAMQKVGRPYPYCGYGSKFADWLYSDTPTPYNSLGNGAAMRVSACGFAAKNIEEAKELSYKVTCVTHNHPEGLKGAESTAVAVFLARNGYTIPEIKDYIDDNYYKMDFSLDSIRNSYSYDISCQGTVPPAIMAFLESNSFEDAIRNAVSIGGDSDTLAAITGAIAEAYYGIPNNIKNRSLIFLDKNLSTILQNFEHKFG